MLGKARGKGTRQGAKDNYECLKLGKCGGLGGGSVVMELEQFVRLILPVSRHYNKEVQHRTATRTGGCFGGLENSNGHERTGLCEAESVAAQHHGNNRGFRSSDEFSNNVSL